MRAEPVRVSERILWIPDDVTAVMRTEASRMAPLETGGVLLGYRAVDHSGLHVLEHVVVLGASGPGPRARHTRMTFVPDPAHDEAMIARAYHQSGGRVTYLGDWHTHPMGGGNLSPQDVRTLQRIAAHKPARAPVPLMVVLAAPDMWNVHAWSGEQRARWLRTRFTVTAIEARAFDGHAMRAALTVIEDAKRSPQL